MSCLLLRRLPPVLLICLLVSACTPAHDKPVQARPPAPAQALRAVMPYFDQSWAMRKLWEDGLAEVATYDAERVIYKKKRTFFYTQITVKEEFNQQFNVKTDDYKRDDLFPMMKINQFCSIPADQYPYHYLTSLFFRRTSPCRCSKCRRRRSSAAALSSPSLITG